MTSNPWTTCAQTGAYPPQPDLASAPSASASRDTGPSVSAPGPPLPPLVWRCHGRVCGTRRRVSRLRRWSNEVLHHRPRSRRCLRLRLVHHRTRLQTRTMGDCVTQSGSYHLTPSDIMDLRTWRAANRHACSFSIAGIDVPYIVCSPSDGTFYLNTKAGTVAGGLAPAVLCALLLNERLEPGFCVRVCEPSCTVEEALATPAERLAARKRLEASAASARAHAASQPPTPADARPKSTPITQTCPWTTFYPLFKRKQCVAHLTPDPYNPILSPMSTLAQTSVGSPAGGDTGTSSPGLNTLDKAWNGRNPSGSRGVSQPGE